MRARHYDIGAQPPAGDAPAWGRIAALCNVSLLLRSGTATLRDIDAPTWRDVCAVREAATRVRGDIVAHLAGRAPLADRDRARAEALAALPVLA